MKFWIHNHNFILVLKLQCHRYATFLLSLTQTHYLDEYMVCFECSNLVFTLKIHANGIGFAQMSLSTYMFEINSTCLLATCKIVQKSAGLILLPLYKDYLVFCCVNVLVMRFLVRDKIQTSVASLNNWEFNFEKSDK